MKKVGKTTRPFRYNLNQIPYDYTVEVRNRFKCLDLIDRVPDELWNEVRDIVQETGIKTISMEKKCKKAKWLSGKALQIAVKRREVKSKGEKERYKPLNAEFQRIALFCNWLMIGSTVRSRPFLSFIEPIFAGNVPFISLIFLKRSVVFPILFFPFISLH